MSVWQLIRTPQLSGSANMQFDLKLFADFERGGMPSALRIYSWRPQCISLGYSQKIDGLIDEQRAAALGWEVVERPTGGGIVFHNEAEVTYSLVTDLDNPLFPKGLVPSYKRISEAIVCGLKKIGLKASISSSHTHRPSSLSSLCFSYPAEYEIVVDGEKIVGSAQKRGRRALLQQGSIFMRSTPTEVFSVLKNNCHGLNAVSVEAVLGRVIDFNDISAALIEGFREELNVKFN